MIPHAAFFFAFGTAQIIFAILFWKRKTMTKLFLFLGMAINGGFFFLWLLTRFLPAPFIGSPESFDLMGILVGLAEVLSLLALAFFLYKKEERKHHVLATVLFASFATVLVVYPMGMLGESMFPQWKMNMSGGHHGGGQMMHDMSGGHH